MKNIRKKLVILFIIILTVISIGNYSLGTNASTPKKLGLYDGNGRKTGYYTSATEKTVKPTIPVIKIVEYNSLGQSVDSSKLEQPVYCLKDGRGFATDSATGSTVVDYTQYFDMRHPDQMSDYRNYLPTNEEDYRKLMWLLDNIAIPEESASVTKLLDDAGGYTKQDFTSQGIGEEQFKDIIEVIQQAAIWYITNKGDDYQPSSNSSFRIARNSGVVGEDLEEKFFEEDLEENPIRDVYSYLLSEMQSKGSYNYLSVDSSPLNLNISSANISYEGNLAIIGPYRINATSSYSNFTADVYNGSSKIDNVTILGSNKGVISGNSTTDKIKNNIGNDFYIQVPAENTQIKLEISSNKTIRNLTYWSTPASNAANNQPVVVINSTSKKYTLNDTKTIQNNSKINVKVTKVWNDENDQDGIRPESIEVDLLKNGVSLEKITLNTSNSWTYSKTDLPMYENGVLQNYTFQEKNIPAGYTASIQKDDITDYIISNNHTPAVTQLTVKKQWNDEENQDGIRPESIEVEVLENGVAKYEYELNLGNNWSHTFTGLPINKNGTPITYTIREKNTPSGYTPSISSDSDNEVTITNTHTPALTKISVNKVWSDFEDKDGLRTSSVTVKLLKNGSSYKEQELNSANNWKYTFTGLPISEGGSKITYTVREKNTPNGYTATVTGDETNGFTITNSHTPNYTSISVRKEWSDSNNQDGIRPNYITVELLANGTKDREIQLNASNNWTYNFENLPLKKDGSDITYSVQEKDVPQGYSQVISGSAEDGFVITNKYTPRVTEISVNKEWDDSNNEEKRPSSVTVQLLANGNVNQEFELNAGNGWSHTFTGLPVKQNGNDIVYSVKEKDSTDLSSYVSRVTGNAQEGFKITNTYQIFDLALRKYITKINGKSLNDMNVESRNPVVNKISEGNFEYKHKKDPILVKNGDVITYQITVYNEGDRLGYANQIIDQLPNGLRLSKVDTVTSKDSNGANKNTYKVNYDENTNRITFDIVSTQQNPAKGINPYRDRMDFETIEINCVVDYRAKFLENNVLTNVAWISSYFDVEENKVVRDVDSQTDNNPDVNKDNMEDYKGKNTNPDDLGNKDYYYQGQQDDDDFEKVYLEDFDLALRKFITAINDKELSTNGVYDRAPKVDIGPLLNGEDRVLYKGSKEPLKVELNDIITYTIRVYNEGRVDGYAEEITDYLPPELEFLPNDEINKKYLWTVDSTGRIVSTKYLAKENNPEGNLIKGYTEESQTLNYKDVQIRCRIKPDSQALKQLTNIAEISKTDNEHGTPNVDNEEKVKRPEDPDLPNYKGKDTNKDDLTDDDFYYEGQEDDDDFEKVVVEKFDLALKKFVTGVNEESITSRIPSVDSSKYGSLVDGKEVTDMEYSTQREPLKLANNDIVIYTIRVYNEGTKSGYASEIKDDIPENLIFLPDNDINKKYKWVLYDSNGNVTTDVKKAVEIRTNYLSKENETEEGEFLLKGFDAQTMQQPNYKDVQVAFRISEMKSSDRIIKNHAEISKDTDENGNEVDDADSTPDEWKENDDDQSEEQVYVKFFDLSLDKIVSQVILIEDGVQKEMDINKNGETEKVVKVELDKKRIENTIIKFKYQIKVTNEGEIEGYATEISDYIPDGLKFNQADNPKWREENGKIITDQLTNPSFQPPETVTDDVILTCIKGDENLNTKTNVAEISKNDNPHGSSDLDSTPNNQKKDEDDIDEAQVVLTVATGSVPIYIASILGTIIIIGIGAIVIKKYVV